MLEKLVDSLNQLAKNLQAQRMAVDPTRFQDPLAERIEWVPLLPGGASLRTSKLVQVDTSRVEFRATTGVLALSVGLTVTGLAVLGGALLMILPGPDPEASVALPPAIMGTLMGLAFAGSGAAMLWSHTSPSVFDKRLDLFWKGRQPPEAVPGATLPKHAARLYDIHALQLITERVRSGKTSFRSHELNLVLRDGTRVNVVDHGDRARLREDAEVLARFLAKPLWDAAAAMP